MRDQTDDRSLPFNITPSVLTRPRPCTFELVVGACGRWSNPEVRWGSFHLDRPRAGRARPRIADGPLAHSFKRDRYHDETAAAPWRRLPPSGAPAGAGMPFKRYKCLFLWPCYKFDQKHISQSSTNQAATQPNTSLGTVVRQRFLSRYCKCKRCHRIFAKRGFIVFGFDQGIRTRCRSRPPRSPTKAVRPDGAQLVPTTPPQLLQLLESRRLGPALLPPTLLSQRFSPAKEPADQAHTAPAGHLGGVERHRLLPRDGQEERVQSFGDTADGIESGLDLRRGAADAAIQSGHCTAPRWADSNGGGCAHHPRYVDADCNLFR